MATATVTRAIALIALALIVLGWATSSTTASPTIDFGVVGVAK